MIIISPFIYPKGLGSSARLGIENFEAAKKELESLYQHDSIFESLEKSSYFEEAGKNNSLSEIKSLISEIKEKQCITGNLSSLSYNIKWLGAAILIKDENIAGKAIKNILSHKDNSISSIILQLNSLKNKISEMESLHEKLSKGSLSLDVIALLEQDFREKHEKLNEAYDKQKKVLLSLSNVFAELAKDAIRKKEK